MLRRPTILFFSVPSIRMTGSTGNWFSLLNPPPVMVLAVSVRPIVPATPRGVGMFEKVAVPEVAKVSARAAPPKRFPRVTPEALAMNQNGTIGLSVGPVERVCGERVCGEGYGAVLDNFSRAGDVQLADMHPLQRADQPRRYPFVDFAVVSQIRARASAIAFCWSHRA
ncbi:MAG TPA: hypothetical protein VGC40_04125 [Paenirhodobacter sp.]